MGFKVSFSKNNHDRFYLPGQEIKISRGIMSQKNYTTESDNVLTCRSRTIFTICCFFVIFCILACRVICVCLGNGINIDTAIADNNLGVDEFIKLKNPVKRADILDRLYRAGVFYDPEHGILDDFPESNRKYFWEIIEQQALT